MSDTADTIYPGTRERQERRVLGLRWIDALVLSALVSVVCLVSLPRLADYVRRTNEGDAQVALGLIGPAVFPEGALVPVADPGEVADWSRTLRHRLRDARPLQDGSGLLYHGYLFALRPTQDGGTWLVAWPRRGGCTGAGVFAWSPTRGALVADGQTCVRWSGVSGDDRPLDPDCWSALEGE